MIVVYNATGTIGGKSKGVELKWENDSIMQLNSYNYNVVPVVRFLDEEETPF